MLRFIVAITYVVLYLIIMSPVQLVMWIMSHCGKYVQISETAFRMNRRILGHLVKISGIRLDVRGLENIPEDKAVLFCGNHRSYFDIITTYSVLPVTTGYVAKQQLANVPLLGGWMLLAGGVALDRKDIKKGLQSILEAIEHVNKGISMFIFPEGTRLKTGIEPAEFHEASFKIAQRSGCEIIPVTLIGTREIFEDHIPFITPCDVIIDFGKPVSYEKRIGAALRQQIIDTYAKNTSLPA